MRVQIFPMQDDLLMIDNACSRFGAKLEIGGRVERDDVLEGFQGVGGMWECVCYIECKSIIDAENILG